MLIISSALIMAGLTVYLFALGEVVVGICFILLTGYQILVGLLLKHIEELNETIEFQEDFIEVFTDEEYRWIAKG